MTSSLDPLPLRTQLVSRRSLRPAAVTLFALLAIAQVGVAVFSWWEPPFDGHIHYAATVEAGGAYWPMNVLLGGPAYAVGFVASAVFLAVLGRGSRLALVGSVVLGVSGIVFALVITAEVLPFVWVADPGVVDAGQAPALFEAFNEQLDVFLPYVIGSMAAIALGTLLAVVGAVLAGGLPRWVLVVVVVLGVATFAAPMGSALAVVVALAENVVWVFIGWLGLQAALDGS